MKRRDVLESVQDCEELYGALTTNSLVTRRDVMRCVRAGLAKSVGRRRLMNPDGDWIKPAIYREGFKLTDDGARWLRNGGWIR